MLVLYETYESNATNILSSWEKSEQEMSSSWPSITQKERDQCKFYGVSDLLGLYEGSKGKGVRKYKLACNNDCFLPFLIKAFPRLWIVDDYK